MTPESLDEVDSSHDHARLRPAEQLVAGEGHEIGARAEALRRRRLIADRRQGARAEIVDQRKLASVGNLGDLGERRSLGEPDDAEVRLVHTEQERGVRPDCALVVRGTRPVRRPDLDEPGAGPGEDVRNAEAVPDLDELPARDDDLAPLGERGEREQHGRGVVVHDESSFGAGQPAEQRRQVILPRSAFPPLEVVLEIRVPGTDLRDARERSVRERSAAEVRVHDDAGRIEDAPQHRLAIPLEPRERRLHEVARIATCSDLLAGLLQRRTGRGDGRRMRLTGDSLVAQKLVDRRQISKRAHAQESRPSQAEPSASRWS